MVKWFAHPGLLALLLVAFATGDPPDAGAKARGGADHVLVIHAQPTDKLSAGLRAIQLANGTVLGTHKDLVVRVAPAKSAAAIKALVKAGAKVRRFTAAQKAITPITHLLLSFRKAPTAAQLRKLDLKLVKRHDHPDGVLLMVKLLGPLTAGLVDRLAKEPDLTHAEISLRITVPQGPRSTAKISKRKPSKLTSPNDPYLGELWGMAHIKAPRAWKNNARSPVVVAIIDYGVDLLHEDLKPHLVKGFNAVNQMAPPADDNGHGTHVAGIIGAVGNNGKGVAGVCWNVQILPCKFIGSGDQGGDPIDVVECIDFAIARGARIINASWGTDNYSKAIHRAIDRANKKGILFVASCGNDGQDNDAQPHYPSGYDLPNIIAVAAINKRNELNSISNFGGKSVHLAAPGEDICSTVPGGYGHKTGTSMAAPHVAGAAALILGHPAYRDYQAKELKALLLKHVRKIPALSGKCRTGGTLDIAFLGK